MNMHNFYLKQFMAGHSAKADATEQRFLTAGASPMYAKFRARENLLDRSRGLAVCEPYVDDALRFMKEVLTLEKQSPEIWKGAAREGLLVLLASLYWGGTCDGATDQQMEVAALGIEAKLKTLDVQKEWDAIAGTLKAHATWNADALAFLQNPEAIPTSQYLKATVIKFMGAFNNPKAVKTVIHKHCPPPHFLMSLPDDRRRACLVDLARLPDVGGLSHD